MSQPQAARSPATGGVIQVRGLSHYYGQRRALQDVSFTIADREVVGFLGLNGAGKSTTLKILAGVLTPTSGDIAIDGLNLSTAGRELRGRIGFLPEEPPLYREMRVGDFLRYVGGLHGMTRAELGPRVPEVLALVQLAEEERRVIGELSNGQRKRVGIAQAIVHRPKLVILDEPIAGLDPQQIETMRVIIRALKADATVLVSSHILSEVEQTCDRLLVLKGGRIVANGTQAEIAHGAQEGIGLALSLRGTPEVIRSFFAARKEVTGAQVEAQPDGTVRADVVLARDEREALVAALVSAGVGVRALAERKSELEQLFNDLMREGAA